MSQIYAITPGIPFCPSAQGKQTKLSIVVRITGIVFGMGTITMGGLILCGTPGIIHLGRVVAWVAISAGGILVPASVSIKCVSQKTQKKKKALNTVDEFDLNNIGISKNKDIQISEETILKLQSSMKNILQREEVEGIKFYTSQGFHRVFALDTAPDIIFKMSPYNNDSISQRYQTMMKANEVCRTHKLGLLVIPQAELFTVGVKDEEYTIIAERKLDINPNPSVQEQYYEEYADSLNEAIRQLAIFICKTGYSDVEWRNNPILNNSLDRYGNRKFALIDLEEMGNPAMGLSGGNMRRGLVGCVNKKQGEIVQNVARNNGIELPFFAHAHARRKEELKDGKRLVEYYSATHKVRGDEPIVIDTDSIDFSPYPPEKVVILRKLASDLVNAINETTAKSSPEESIKGRRHIHINTNHDQRFQWMDHKLIIKAGEVGYQGGKMNEEYHDATYLGCVVNKFLQMGLIYKVISRSGHGYMIQA